MPTKDFDVIVAGGGLIGLVTAAAVAVYSNQRASILVVDRNSEQDAGKKTINGWTCGDAVSKRSIDYVAKHLGIHYGSPELEHPVKGVLVFSPDHKTSVLFDGEGYLLNRKILPQRQIRDAKKLGISFQFNVALDRLLVEDNAVTGVVGRHLTDKSVFKLGAKMIIDATGSASKLRTSLSINSKIQREIDRDDVEATGRYIYKFSQEGNDRSYFDPDYCLIHLDQYLAPGGYSWTFPKGKNKVNIGLGVQKSALARRNQRYGLNDNLQSLIDTYVTQNRTIARCTLSDDADDEGNSKGSWQVPVRRQNDCMVTSGYAVIGDAAWMPRPIDAGGIGPALYASVILGKTVAGALETNDMSEKSLWPYNVEYMKTYGYQMASFQVLRAYLQTITNSDIDYGMKHFLTQDDIADITERKHPKFQRTRFLNPMMWLRIMKASKLASGLRDTAKKSETLIQHNLDYPETPQGFPEWQKGLMRKMENAISP